MNAIAPQFIVMILCYLAMGLASIVLFVLGIMIVANKTKPTKVLGIGYIITSFSTCIVFLFNVLLLISTDIVLVYGDAVMIGTILCVLANSLCVCIYLHKNYGKKFIYIPVLLLSIAGPIIGTGIAIVINVVSEAGITNSMAISLINDVSNIVAITLMAVIIIVVLYKNREREKIIPKAWLAKTITVIWSAIEIVVICITYLSIINGAETEGLEAYSESKLMVLNMVQAMDSLVAIIVPVYVLSRVRKVSKQEKAA